MKVKNSIHSFILSLGSNHHSRLHGSISHNKASLNPAMVQDTNENDRHQDESRKRALSTSRPVTNSSSVHLQPDTNNINSNSSDHIDSAAMVKPSHAKRRRKKPETKLERYMKLPWVVYILTTVQTVVFIAEFIRMGVLTGSPIQTQPTFNPMIGPSTYLLINMGARFTPCMHGIDKITNDPMLRFPCPNSTTATTNVCSLAELCGMAGGVVDPAGLETAIKAGATDANSAPLKPNQWWRFITPIFLHAGIIHLGFNMLLQVRLGGEIEQNIGHVRFLIVYFVAGIGGFLLGGNFTPDGIASTGASGALFGLIALDLLDLLFNWSVFTNPYRTLVLHVFEFVVSFVIGLLPGLDNFSHIGGFAMGLVMGTAVLPSPRMLRKKKRRHLRMLRRDKAQRQMELELGEIGDNIDYNDHDNTNNTNYNDGSLDEPQTQPDSENSSYVKGFDKKRYVFQTECDSEKDNTFVINTFLATSAGESSSDNGSMLSTISKSKANMTNSQQKYNTTDNTPLSNYSFPQNNGSQQPIYMPTDTRTNTKQSGGLDHSDRNQKTVQCNFRSSTGTKPHHVSHNVPTYNVHSGSSNTIVQQSAYKLLNRRPRSWYTWMTVRVICFLLVIAYYVGLIVNFSRGGGNCSWCKYLSCLPVHGWCDMGYLQVSSNANHDNKSATVGYILMYLLDQLLFGYERPK